MLFYIFANLNSFVRISFEFLCYLYIESVCYNLIDKYFEIIFFYIYLFSILLISYMLLSLSVVFFLSLGKGKHVGVCISFVEICVDCIVGKG